MVKNMNVLSLFNGMSVGSMALEDAGVKVDKTYISEIDKYANKATETLFPDSIQLGSVLDWREWNIDWSSIELVTGGFPCQAWSMAGKQLGDKDERGMLFWTMLDIMKQVRHYNPKANFLIENVRMKKEFEEYITHHTENALGEVYKVLINSALVSAQNRNRYYWTSFPVSQPEDKGIVLADILEGGADDGYFSGKDVKGHFENNKFKLTFEQFSPDSTAINRVLSNIRTPFDKGLCLLSSSHKGMAANGTTNVIQHFHCRKLTPRECMRLQTIPEHYIDKLLESGISNTQLYKMTGNSWTMKVISHIFKEIKK